MFVAIDDDEYEAEADTAERGGEYVCPICRRQVITKRGAKVIPHFAHRPGADCSHGVGETRAHREAKVKIAKWLRRKGHDVAIEWPLGDRIADVYDITDNAVYEVQFSSTDATLMRARNRDYKAAGVGRVTWVWKWEPMPEHGDDAIKLNMALRHFVRKPQLAATFIDRDQLLQASLCSGVIHVPVTTWFEAGGYEASGGGYDRVAKRWCKANVFNTVTL